MKTVYYLPFTYIKPDRLNVANVLSDIHLAIRVFKDNFFKDQDVLIIPSFSGKEGLECMPERLNN